MKSEAEIIIEERIEKLPKSVVEAIKNVPWVERMKKIAKANNLDTKQTEGFETETTLIVLGIESPENYPENLSQNVGLSDDMVISIAKEVNKQIIEPIISAVNRKKEKIQPINSPAPTPTPSNLPVLEPDFAKETLMVKPNETAHPVEPLTGNQQPTTDSEQQISKEKKPPFQPPEGSVQPAKSAYADGQDPYREPIV